jgi:hypothetical protein
MPLPIDTYSDMNLTVNVLFGMVLALVSFALIRIFGRPR